MTDAHGDHPDLEDLVPGIREILDANRPGPYTLTFTVDGDGQFGLHAPAESLPNGKRLYPTDVWDVVAWAAMRWALQWLTEADSAVDVADWRYWLRRYETALGKPQHFDSDLSSDYEPLQPLESTRWSAVWVFDDSFAASIEDSDLEGARLAARDKFHVAVSLLIHQPRSDLNGWILAEALGGLVPLSAWPAVRTDPALQQVLADVLYGTALTAHRFAMDYKDMVAPDPPV